MDPRPIQAMEDEINLLKEKVDYLNDGNQRLHDLYDKRGEHIQNLQNKLETCENQNGTIFGLKSKNQVCERKVEGIEQIFIRLCCNINSNAINNGVIVINILF